MKVIVVDIDGSLAAQPCLRDMIARGAAEKVPARDLAFRLRIVADRTAAIALRERLEAVWPEEPTLIFYGSGDFHHLCALFLGLVEEPVTVIQFDNHPDWTSFPKTLNCGSWVNRALELAHVEKVVTIGPAADDFIRPERKHANLQAIRDGRLEVHPWRAAPSRIRGAAVDGPGCRTEDRTLVWNQLAEMDFEAFIEDLDERLPHTAIWVTLDKDVLGPREAVTNWDQSELSLDMITAAIRKLGRSRRVLGIDVCGDYSKPRYADPFRLLLSLTDHPRMPTPSEASLSVNDRTNARIIGAFGDQAS